MKLGGIGLRSLVDTSYVTYIGAVEQVIPHIVGVGGEEGLAPHLEAVIGIREGAGCWQQFLQSGSRTAAEFQQSWETLNREALGEWHLLGQEPTGPLAAEPMDAGWNSVNGSTRNKVTEQLEELRHLVIQHTCKFPRQRCKACRCLPKSSGQGGWKVAVGMSWSSHKFFFGCLQRGPISPPCTSLPYSGDKSLGW